MKRLLLICGLALLSVPAAWAAHNQPLAFFNSNEVSIHAAVSQQPGATNDIWATTGESGCVWDAGDYLRHDLVLNVALDPGESGSDTICLVEDWASHAVHTAIAAASPNLDMTITFNTGQSVTVVPVFDKRLGLWAYNSCTLTPTYTPGDPALASVPTGGLGVKTVVRFTVSNPSSKVVAKMRYFWGIWPATTC